MGPPGPTTIMFPTLYHYTGSSDPIQLFHCVQRTGDFSFKPHGLWVTPDDEYNWEWWSRAEQFNVENLTHRFSIQLKPSAEILWIKNSMQLDQFAKEFSKTPSLPGFHDLYAIDWHKVAEKYQGILIIPYIWERRMDTMWYYSWDCSSGCLWDPEVVESIQLDTHYVPKIEDNSDKTTLD